MYFPYMRGKQFELVALKTVAARLKTDKVFPIIEPVNDNLTQLISCIQSLNQYKISPHIIINPEVGDLANDSPDSLNLEIAKTGTSFIPCIRINNQNLQYVTNLLDQFIEDNVNYSLYFQEGILSKVDHYTHKAMYNIIREINRYPDDFANKLPNSVVINDSFPAKSRNADYSNTPQFFSDAHLTFTKPLVEHQVGFGDYLTIDETWTTGGGPAFVIALHITYIDNDTTHMYVKHSVSISNPGDQSNPAGKFREALEELIKFSHITPSLNKNTLGFQEYVIIHQNGNYPGLGVPKKLSMMHHIETISDFL
ncbi:sce7725 family protein [Photobacterium lucens]|uniref:sce7725 family protein n=1 Tax=Photobacterium lucens TaxID=2562949 RepID=UPI00136D845F|nr:sce7725 family protein [Photobacterium lucens]MBP2699927.1 sce7725 family protein [Vibrio parahaemolyticus]MZG56253.1 ATP-binding protein [Photobacterium lucens]MZG80446.1 ATP-binding protein [Photobacterium lucens]